MNELDTSLEGKESGGEYVCFILMAITEYKQGALHVVNTKT